MTEKQAAPRTGRAAGVRHWLTRPPPDARTADEQRRARFLSAVLLAAIPVFAAADLLMTALVPLHQPWVGWYGMLAAAYVLNRFGSHRYASRLACWMIPTVVLGVIVLDARIGTSHLLSLPFLLIGTLLATVVLGARESVAFTLVILGGAACVPLVVPAEATGWGRAWVTALAINTVGAAIAIAYRRLRDTTEAEHAAELRNREEHYRNLVESNSDWLWEVDPEGRYTYVSPQIEKVLGYHPDELLGRRCFDLMPADEAERLAPEVAALIESRSPIVRMRNRNVARDGRIVVLETSGKPILDAAGTLTGYRGVDRDVTDREATTRDRDRLRAELERNVYLLEHVLNGIPDVIGVQDLHHGVIRYNEAGYRLLGVASNEIHGTRCFDLLGRRTPCAECATAEALRTGQNARLEKFSPELGVWFDARAYPVKNAQGTIAYVIEHLRDITEQKEIEERMRREAAFRQAVVQNAAEGISACHAIPDFPFVRFTVWNTCMTDLTGYTMGEINRLGWYQTVYPDPATQRRAMDRMEQMRRGEHLQAEEWDITCKDGTQRTLAISTSSFTLGNEGEPQVLAVMQDVTQRVEAKRQLHDHELRLRHAEKMEAIGQLAGGVAHDFNNQLAGILGYAEMLQQMVHDRKDLRLYVSRILSAAERSARLTRQLLSFARKGPMEMEPVDLHAVIADVAAILHRSIDKRIELTQRLDAHPSLTWGDASQIENALLNIGINARDAMPEGGTMEFSSDVVEIKPGDLRGHPPAEPGRYVRVGIRDTGSGIDDATLSHLFEPFFTTKPRGKGTGLGLSAVYGIVQAHRGFITVDSEPGRGTLFSVHFPASAKLVPLQAETAGRADGPQGAIHVMLVDDEKVVVEVASILLKAMGHRVTAMTNPMQAVEFFARHWKDVDLVMLDMIMPKLSGRDVFDKVVEINPDAKVLLCSGYSVEGEAEGLLKRGAVGFLQKPFTRESLAQKLSEAMAVAR